MMKYAIGEFRELIEIKRETLSTTHDGGQNVSLTTIYNGWAMVYPQRAVESGKDDRVSYTQGYNFIVRNLKLSIRANDRILWNGQEWNIREVEEQRNHPLYIKIVAESGVTQ